MNYRALLLLASVAACPTSVFAQAEEGEVLRGPAPTWAEPLELRPLPEDASGLLYFRKQNTVIRLDDSGEKTFLAQRVALLHPQALQLGNIQIEWNPASGAPVIHALKIHRDGQEINVLDNASFEVLRREDLLDQAMLTGLLTAVLQVPDLRVGDELEISYTVPTAAPTLGAQSFGLLSMAHTPAPGRFRLGVSWDDGQEPRFKFSQDVEAGVVRTPGRLSILFDEPENITPPRDAPFRYNWMRAIEYTDFASWEEVSSRFAALYRAASSLGPDSAVRQEAARIAAAYDSDADRAAAALKLVQQQVRYIYVGLNGGNFSPATAEETWQRRFGDCKGKTTLLLALLNELGIDSEAVLANNAGFDDGLVARLPSPGLFDHVLVRARIDGQTLWMDGTMPPVARASVEPIIGYRWVLPLSDGGSGIDEIAPKPFTLPQEMGLYEIDARDGFEEPATVTSASITRGIEGLAEFLQLSALSSDQLETAFRTQLAGSEQWDTIDSVTYRFDEKTQASILTIKGTGPVDWENERGNGYSLELPGGGFIPPSRRQRSRDQDRTAPYYSPPSYSCYVTTVRVPETTSVDDWTYNSTFDTELFGRNYYRTMEIGDDGTIRMIRGARQDIFEISPEQAARENGQIADFDNSKAVIRYYPGLLSGDDAGDAAAENDKRPRQVLSDESRQAIAYARAKADRVPATHEIDWASPDVPCLPEWVLDK